MPVNQKLSNYSKREFSAQNLGELTESVGTRLENEWKGRHINWPKTKIKNLNLNPKQPKPNTHAVEKLL